MREPFFRLLSAGLVGLCATCSLVAQAAPVDCGATVPGIRMSYFTRIGIGAAYGPHYPCYNISDGTIAPCFNNDGTPANGVQADAKNNELQSSVPLDLTQIQLAGFTSVRAYGDPARVWIAMINVANNLNLNIVYQVSTCKSDAALAGHPCLNVPGVKFEEVLAFSLVQLRQVIKQVTPAVFQKVINLIIVGNEDLVISPKDNQTYNTADLIGAIRSTEMELRNDGVKVNNGSGSGVDLSSATVIGQMTTLPGMQLATAYTPGAPVIENIYGAQFSSVKTPADAVTFLKNAVNKLQAQYSNNPAMLGETGWWTEGQDAGYDASTRVGTLADAIAYYQGLYPYLTSCFVPTLIFEAFDQPQKGPADEKKTNPPGTLEAEQYYGVMKPFNIAKDRALLPGPAPTYQDHPETAQAALFTFVLAPKSVDMAPAMTFGIQQPGQNSPTKVTVQPFAEVTNARGGTTPVWPTFNLYAGSKMFLFRSAQSANAQCSNTVTSVFTTSQLVPNDPRRYVPPFSGGLWADKKENAPGCPRYTDTSVNWGDGNTNGSYAQNVFLSASFPQ